jgi:hypothetical protein
MSRDLFPRRVLEIVLLPLSLLPVFLLAPSLARAPETLWRHTAHLLARARVPRPVEHYRLPGPYPILIGATRLEVDLLEGLAGPLTPRVGVSPFVEPEWLARELRSR